jgi:hypothetical protein
MFLLNKGKNIRHCVSFGARISFSRSSLSIYFVRIMTGGIDGASEALLLHGERTEPTDMRSPFASGIGIVAERVSQAVFKAGSAEKVSQASEAGFAERVSRASGTGLAERGT